MNRSPLVSVVIPCYNAAATLPWALASLLAQSRQDWECIVVDDGSTDHPEEVVAALGDARIRLVRFAGNQGRAAARQAGLDQARGDLLAKLDADDWLYPHKLAIQVDVMQRLPEAGLVSTGIAIEDADRRLLGVRARGEAGACRLRQPLGRPAALPVAHAASMLRMEIAKRHGYNQRLRRAEDADFLLRVLLANRFCILHDVLYAYGEYRNVSQSETLDAYRQRMAMFWTYRRRYPLTSAVRVVQTAAKWTAYRVAFAAGRQAVLVRRRSVAPTPDDVQAHEAAWANVAQVHDSFFEPAAPAAQPESAAARA